MGLLKILFIITIAILFLLGEIFRINLSSGVSIRLLDLGVGILVAFWLLLHLLRGKKIKSQLVLLPVLIFSGIGAISLLINSQFLTTKEFITSALYLARWVSYAGLYFVVKGFDVKFKNSIVKSMLIGGGVVVFAGYLQYFFYSNLRNLYYLGWDEHMHRLFSSFLDPNFAGAFLVLYSLFLLGLMFKKIERDSKNKLIMLGSVLILTTVAAFLTYSRSALLMLFFSLLAFLIIKKMKKWILLVILLFLMFFVVGYQNFYIENLNLLRIASSEARIESAQNAIAIIAKNPILGVGFNAYRYAQIRYGFRGGAGAEVSHADAGTDNSFLFVLATTGIVGFIAYIWLWFRILRKNAASALILASIVGVFVNSLFINSLFYPFIMLWLWILIAVTENK